MKTCTLCNKEKAKTNFGVKRQAKDGLSPWCRECQEQKTHENYYSKNGIARQLYSDHCKAHKRNIAPAAYTLGELKGWLFSNPQFEILYRVWVQSGFKKELKPSTDRINDYQGYSLDNLQLTTWKENKYRFYKDLKTGVNRKRLKAVIKLSRTGESIQKYYSMAQAARENNIALANISRAVLGKRPTAGGFRWEYA